MISYETKIRAQRRPRLQEMVEKLPTGNIDSCISQTMAICTDSQNILHEEKTIYYPHSIQALLGALFF